MLTGIHIAFAGGDARHLEVIRKCVELDATVTLFGYDNLNPPPVGTTKGRWVPGELTGIDVLVLPVVGTDDNGHVESIFAPGTLVFRDEHAAQLKPSTLVFTGMARPYLLNLCQRHRLRLIQLLDVDEVAIYNSIPTMEGALMMAIQNTDITLHDAQTIVLGLGRTGFTLAQGLKALGAHVRVGVRRPEHYARAFAMGYAPFYLRDLAQCVRDVDIVFNTIPALVLTAEVIARMPPHAVIIDLASSPGGTDFRYAEKRGIKALLAPGLPGIVAPKTAGQILANTIIRLILEKKGNQEGLP
ncbi:dipicolinate synthase subunit DpsA [Calditerricola satsumensis]|uniref:Dipicolinate synthase subunit A n=1 Tax=Calditerricola satsumensis TaxID=373054 RepID=A0A8J3B797_9BACI|nr:dipicolinate synthase subunit DpsA [Calditerricola satsumensis]GGJ99340.1 dipicolinate synthase subunit A [Calditerricola satsumensis]